MVPTSISSNNVTAFQLVFPVILPALVIAVVIEVFKKFQRYSKPRATALDKSFRHHNPSLHTGTGNNAQVL